jgi:sulfonate transport system substrate-binding protein
MRAAGEAEPNDYNIAWHRFTQVNDSLLALNAQAVDLAGVGDSGLIAGRTAGLPIKAVAAWRIDGTNTAILARAASPFRTVDDLRGHSVCLSRASMGHFLLLTAVVQGGLPSDAIRLVFMNQSDCKIALSTGAVDACATWGPFTVMEELYNKAQIVLRGTTLSTSAGVLVGTETTLRNKSPLIRDFLARVWRARAWGRLHQADYAHAYARDTGLPLDAALMLIQRDNTRMIQLAGDLESLLSRIQETFFAAGVITNKIDIDAAIDLSFSDIPQN